MTRLRDVGRVIEGLLDVGGRAVIELDCRGQSFVHPGLVRIARILQVAEQRRMNFLGPADPVQIADGLAQRVGIGPVLVVAPVIVEVELVRVDLGAVIRRRSGTRVDRDQVATAAETDRRARAWLPPWRECRAFFGLMAGSSSDRGGRRRRASRSRNRLAL